jgi:hypothetical protein
LKSNLKSCLISEWSVILIKTGIEEMPKNVQQYLLFISLSPSGGTGATVIADVASAKELLM